MLKAMGAIKEKVKGKGKAKAKAKAGCKGGEPTEGEPRTRKSKKTPDASFRKPVKKRRVERIAECPPQEEDLHEGVFANKFHEFDLVSMGLPLFCRPPVKHVGTFRGKENYTVHSKSGASINVLLKVKAFRIIATALSSEPSCPNFAWLKHGGVAEAWEICCKACGFDVPDLAKA